MAHGSVTYLLLEIVIKYKFIDFNYVANTINQANWILNTDWYGRRVFFPTATGD